jgi:hypothetical protein
MAASPTSVNYGSMSTPAIKAVLESHGCDTAGKKQVLVVRLAAKMDELARARTAVALRTVVVSAASTSELDRASAEMRAWHANGSALAQRLAAALSGTESVLQQSDGAAPAGSASAILAQARGAVDAIQAQQARRALSEPYRQVVQACAQLSVVRRQPIDALHRAPHTRIIMCVLAVCLY